MSSDSDTETYYYSQNEDSDEEDWWYDTLSDSDHKKYYTMCIRSPSPPIPRSGMRTPPVLPHSQVLAGRTPPRGLPGTMTPFAHRVPIPMIIDSIPISSLRPGIVDADVNHPAGFQIAMPVQLRRQEDDTSDIRGMINREIREAWAAPGTISDSSDSDDLFEPPPRLPRITGALREALTSSDPRPAPERPEPSVYYRDRDYWSCPLCGEREGMYTFHHLRHHLLTEHQTLAEYIPRAEALEIDSWWARNYSNDYTNYLEDVINDIVRTNTQRGNPPGRMEIAPRILMEELPNMITHRFGKAIKPYRKNIKRIDTTKGVYFNTRFGEQKLRDDATGLYLKGKNKKKMYLHRW
tara:strand:- start:699 stop:1751 length:1053 start_codon:yes stop_codon:yes gene_type:complete